MFYAKDIHAARGGGRAGGGFRGSSVRSGSSSYGGNKPSSNIRSGSRYSYSGSRFSSGTR